MKYFWSLLFIVLIACVPISQQKPPTVLSYTASPRDATPSPVLTPTAPVESANPRISPSPTPTPQPTPLVFYQQPPPFVASTPGPQPPPPPVAATCPANWFCYPRLGIAGLIVPYNDCTGTTDIGTNIRSLVCISPYWLAGHAYTQFGKITQFAAGDVVYAYTRKFIIIGSYVQLCGQPPLQVAPLNLQTSQTSGCGTLLIVQGRAA